MTVESITKDMVEAINVDRLKGGRKGDQKRAIRILYYHGPLTFESLQDELGLCDASLEVVIRSAKENNIIRSESISGVEMYDLNM